MHYIFIKTIDHTWIKSGIIVYNAIKNERKGKRMNRKLLRSVREYKKESILTPILVIFVVFMEVLVPLQMARSIDVGIANNDLS